MRREAKRPLLVGTVILVFLSIFMKSQASSHFETMNSAHLSMSQKDVRTSVPKKWRTMAFSRASTGDSVTLNLVRFPDFKFSFNLYYFSPDSHCSIDFNVNLIQDILIFIFIFFNTFNNILL